MSDLHNNIGHYGAAPGYENRSLEEAERVRQLNVENQRIGPPFR